MSKHLVYICPKTIEGRRTAKLGHVHITYYCCTVYVNGASTVDGIIKKCFRDNAKLKYLQHPRREHQG